MGIWDDRRINYTPCTWVFNADKDDVIKTRIDANGQEMSLIHQQGIICFNPDIGSEFPESTQRKRHWYIPRKVCRKCRYYRKGGENGLRYPHCHWNSQM